jgi:ATP-binding cassette subfamily F protein uup
VIVADHVTKTFGEGAGARAIIKDFSLRITRRDRIGVVGANGAGKTTLLKLLTGELQPDSGTVTLAKTLSGVMIDQQRSLMSPEKRVRDVLAEGGDWIDVRGERKHIQGYLKDFLFDPGLVEARVGTLSGGERSRLLLAREFARKSNLLVLDEPTNDLDLETLDLLQEVIADYDGTVLIVSHDRDFSIAPSPSRWGWTDRARSMSWPAAMPTGKAAQGARGAGQGRAQGGKRPAAASPAAKKGKLSYKDQRDYDCCPKRSRNSMPPLRAARRNWPIRPLRARSEEVRRADGCAGKGPGRQGRGRGALAGTAEMAEG